MPSCPDIKFRFRVLLIFFSVLSVVVAQQGFCLSSNLIDNLRPVYVLSEDKLYISWSDSRSRPLSLIEVYNNKNQKIISRKISGSIVKITAKHFHDTEEYKIKIKPLPLQKFASAAYVKNFTFSTRVKTKAILGEFKTQNSGGRKGTYFLPENYRLKTLPAMLLFHGSSIAGRNVALIFKELARQKKFIIIAPDSSDSSGWSYETDLQLMTEDQRHIEACLLELKRLPNLSIDSEYFLVAGISAGGELAAFYGSNDSRFSSFADMHGGVYLPSLGTNKIPLWLSTGTFDSLRPPSELQSYRDLLPGYGFNDVSYHEYPVAHEIPVQERVDLVNWWLK